jgi:hypothetical protein
MHKPWIIQKARSPILEARRSGPARWIAQCPAHADGAPSLTIGEGREGRVLLHCFAGCALTAVLEAAGLTMQQLFAAGKPRTAREQAVHAAARNRRLALEAVGRRLERDRIDTLRLRWQQKTRQASAMTRTLACMPDGAPGSDDLTVCLHNLFAELRSIESALTGDID